MDEKLAPLLGELLALEPTDDGSSLEGTLPQASPTVPTSAPTATTITQEKPSMANTTGSQGLPLAGALPQVPLETSTGGGLPGVAQIIGSGMDPNWARNNALCARDHYPNYCDYN